MTAGRSAGRRATARVRAAGTGARRFVADFFVRLLLILTRAPVLLVAILVGEAVLEGQTIRGRLLEFQSDEPIALGVVVMVSVTGDSIAAALTDEAGYFEVSAEDEGSYLLEAAALGYKETRVGLFDLGGGGEMSVEFRLWPAPLSIDGVMVESLVEAPELVRNGFHRRMQAGVGTFFSPADIAETTANRVVDMIQGLAGVRMRIDPVDGERLLLRGTKGYCVPTLMVDGIRATWAGTSMRLDELVPLETVYAMEVHRGVSSLPIEFGSFNHCGVIVFWTKRQVRR